jgi:hypothetical protein
LSIVVSANVFTFSAVISSNVTNNLLYLFPLNVMFRFEYFYWDPSMMSPNKKTAFVI